MTESVCPPVSVVMAAHSMDRWALLVSACESVHEQVHTPAEIILSIDHNDDLFDRARRELDGIVVVANEGPTGASGTRNAGVRLATQDYVAFLDDDIKADPHWLDLLLRPFADSTVVGTGGGIDAAWVNGKPRWFPDEFGWVVGGSFKGMPEVTAPIRNVWSENMAVRTQAFRDVGGFREDFGKVLNQSRPEDTDLCIRMSALAPGNQWIYVPAARVQHHVPAERSTVSFFMERCYSEGRGKAEMAAFIDAPDTLSRERDYVKAVLLAGLVERARTCLKRHSLAAGLQAVAILAGSAAAAAAAAVSWTKHKLGR
jgi:glucosyl-dolichyl phosphate glucuronosyltransferase